MTAKFLPAAMVHVGYTNREIALALFLAKGTVKNYVSEILAKLDARDRTQAALKAISWRLICRRPIRASLQRGGHLIDLRTQGLGLWPKSVSHGLDELKMLRCCGQVAALAQHAGSHQRKAKLQQCVLIVPCFELVEHLAGRSMGSG